MCDVVCISDTNDVCVMLCVSDVIYIGCMSDVRDVVCDVVCKRYCVYE